ncbi:MAG TPA: hypothetical protein VGO50_18985 [Pyrinomonadaceae bacterium]|jgi:hypothetical protein|nr:hypothetical protein [Pyrinomonadaceae bacterium]
MFSSDRLPAIKAIEKGFSDLKPFPRDARVRIGVMGLAYCTLDKPESQVKFLTHVRDHKLDMVLFQGKRGGAMSMIFASRVERGKIGVSLGADAILPVSVQTPGDYLLAETLNLQKIHGNQPIFVKAGHGGKSEPVVLTLNKCAFYTEEMTAAVFDLIEINTQTMSETTVATRKFGDIIGGKMRCLSTARGSLSINIEYPIATDLKMDNKYPLLDTDGTQFIYDLYFLNHCVTNETGTEEDFGRYYEVLEDRSAPKTFKIKKVPALMEEAVEEGDREIKKSPFNEDINKADIAACNPVIIDPPEPYMP